MRQYRQIVAKYGPSNVEVNNQNTFYGVAKAYDVVKVLYLAGKNPTRQSLMNATLKMNWVNPYTIKGIKIKTGKIDHFPISQMRLIRYGNGSWSVGDEPPIFGEFRSILNNMELYILRRFDFYDAARGPDLALVIATGERRIYANILLTIGVVAPA